MIILDTNVLSALMDASPEPTVIDWLDRQQRGSIWTTALTVFEIRSGIERTQVGRRRQYLDDSFQRVITQDLQGRVLSFDRAAAYEAGRREAMRRREGFTDDVRDTQIAGIVLAQRASLATRNVRHFADLGSRVVSPWSMH